MIKPIITAIRTLTIVPIPGKDTSNFSQSLIFFPLVGGLIALCVFGAMKVGFYFLPQHGSIIAMVMILTSTIVTGAIHCDGLADFCDGFFGGKTKDQILIIMKDPRVGSFGVIALIFDFGFKFFLYTSLIKVNSWYIIAFSIILSRQMQAACASFLPYARPEGGTAAPFFCDKNSKVYVIISTVILFATCAFFNDFLRTIIFFVIAIVLTIVFMIFCKCKIGGITGDCIGANNELVENGVLFASLFLL